MRRCLEIAEQPALREVSTGAVKPTLVGGNSNAPTIMIAERAADLITGRTAASALPRASQPAPA